MIDLTPADIEEFRVLFRKETGKEITAAQAEEYAQSMLTVVYLLARPEGSPPPGAA